MLSLWCKTYMQQDEKWITDMLENIRSHMQTAQVLAELHEELLPPVQQDTDSPVFSKNIFSLSECR